MTDLTCDKIGALSGGMFGTVVDDVLNTIKADLDNRGDDALPRVLTITISFKREVSRDKESVIIDACVKPKLPDYRPMPTIAKVRVQAGEPVLFFQEETPENPDQPPLRFEERKGPEQQS